MSDVMSYTN